MIWWGIRKPIDGCKTKEEEDDDDDGFITCLLQ
jgi:hypothetical protein